MTLRQRAYAVAQARRAQVILAHKPDPGEPTEAQIAEIEREIAPRGSGPPGTGTAGEVSGGG